MKHAAKPPQLKLAFFFTFIAFVTLIIEPFIQFAFFLQPFIQFIIELLLIFAVTEFPFLFELEQQTCRWSVVLSAHAPSRTVAGPEAPQGESAHRFQTSGRKRSIVDLRPQARLCLLSLCMDRYGHRLPLR